MDSYSQMAREEKITFIIPVGRRFIGDTVEFQRHPVSSAGGCAVNEMFHETSGSAIAREKHPPSLSSLNARNLAEKKNREVDPESPDA